ncbi:MAG: DUF4091 domain-containing protein [Candidatus Latescibacteria bacterium]|nr:DUF4091 domain-containing protein [Candidatus Latescibacterota bacterium]
MSGEWTQWRGDKQRTGRAGVAGRISRPRIDWKHFAGCREDWISIGPGNGGRLVLPTGEMEAVSRQYGLAGYLDVDGSGQLVKVAESTGSQFYLRALDPLCRCGRRRVGRDSGALQRWVSVLCEGRGMMMVTMRLLRGRRGMTHSGPFPRRGPFPLLALAPLPHLPTPRTFPARPLPGKGLQGHFPAAGWLALPLLFCLVLVAEAQQVQVPNPSFEVGQGQPAGWLLEGEGQWIEGGAEGERALAVRGDGESTSFWRSGLLSMKPGGLYLLRFMARSLEGGGGTPTSGPVFCNRDLGDLGRQWSEQTSVFQAPDSLDAERAWLRFGQWHLKGRVAFDAVSLAEAQPVYTRQGEVLLGEGEEIDGRRYTFAAPFHSSSRNHSRPLAAQRCDFNTNRWIFGAGSYVIYRHELAGRPQRGAKVAVTIGYYQAGELVVEASADGERWRELGALGKAGSRSLALPGELLPASAIWIRLRARAKAALGLDSAPGSFQVHSYTYGSIVEDASLRLQGHTQFVVIQGTDPRLKVQVRGLGEQVPGGDNRIAVQVENTTGETLSLPQQVRVVKDGETTVFVRASDAELPPGLRVLYPPYELPGDGSFWVEYSLGEFRAGAGVYLASLYATRYGEQLPGSSEAVGLWWASSGYKVSRQRPLPQAKGQALRIRAAGDEREAAQLVVRSVQALRGLWAKPQELVGPEGHHIAAGQIEILRVAYVPVAQPSDYSGAAALWPDPLPPLDRPIDMPAGINQPLWVRVHVPPGTPAGRYTGVIELQAEGFSAQVPLQVEVYDFELPRRMTCTTAFGFSPEEVFRYQKLSDPQDKRAVLDLYTENFSAHRISPYDPVPLDHFEVKWSPTVKPSFLWQDWDRAMSRAIDTLGFNSFRLPVLGLGSGTYQNRTEPKLQGFGEKSPQYREGLRAYLGALEQHLTKKGWLDEAYVYWFDEPEPKDYPFVMGGFAKLKAHAPRIRRMLTEQVEPALIGGPNIWCALTPEYDSTAVAQRQQGGDSFWWYVCTSPKAPYAGLFIDHPATEMRVWLWQTWQHHLQGVLVWQTNYWTSDAAYPDRPQNPYADPMSWVSGYSTEKGNKLPWGNGDGRFLYPPEAAASGQAHEPVLSGPVDSMRWEMLRDGIEDYEYFVMLKRLLAERGATLGVEERRQYEALLQVPEAVSANLTRFTDDPAPLEAHRDQLARAIEMLGR